MVKIYNRAKLPYDIIGKIIDHYIKSGDDGETLYIGKQDIVRFEYKNKKYEAYIEYREGYVYWLFNKINEIKYN